MWNDGSRPRNVHPLSHTIKQRSLHFHHVLSSAIGTNTAFKKYRLHVLTSLSSSSTNPPINIYTVSRMTARVGCNRHKEMLPPSLSLIPCRLTCYQQCVITVQGLSVWLSTWPHTPISITTGILKIPRLLYLKGFFFSLKEKSVILFSFFKSESFQLRYYC